MQLWQMDVMGGVELDDGTELKVVTGVDDHSRFCVAAGLVIRATSKAVCEVLVASLRRYGIPDEILTDNGKVFTGRFGPQPVEVLSSANATDGIGGSPPISSDDSLTKAFALRLADHIARPFGRNDIPPAARPHPAMGKAIDERRVIHEPDPTGHSFKPRRAAWKWKPVPSRSDPRGRLPAARRWNPVGLGGTSSPQFRVNAVVSGHDRRYHVPGEAGR